MYSDGLSNCSAARSNRPKRGSPHSPMATVAMVKTRQGTVISRTDARRLLEAWLHHEYEGGSNKEIRAHIRASLDLANNLQHRRTATRKLAALCLEATSSAVAVVAILAGRWEG